jgi:hypothetical protein
MICPECKVANADDHNYCKHCGFPLRAHAVGRDLRMGSAEHARDRCLLIVKHNPDSPEAYFNLGMAYYHSRVGSRVARAGALNNGARAGLRPAPTGW